MKKIGILGCGAWATTIARCFASNGHSVYILCHKDTYVTDINQSHENKIKLPGIKLSPTIVAIKEPDIFEECDCIVLACPSQHLDWITTIKPCIKKKTPLLNIIKGVVDTYLDDSRLEDNRNVKIINHNWLISSYIKYHFPDSSYAVLSGPNLASEISKDLPAASVIASSDLNLANQLQSYLSSSYFRVYTSSDVLGVELGGILKNMMAIAAGISDTLNLGQNAKSALIARGLQEMIRFGNAFGAQMDTFYGLSGLGDLVATCGSDLSRNYRCGVGLAQGMSLDDLLQTNQLTAEGARTTKLIHHLAQSMSIEMPVTAQVYAVLYEGKPCEAALNDLMLRRLTSE